MIKIKTDNITNTEFQNGIIKKIYEITKEKIPITITSSGGKLIKLEIDDEKLSSSMKKELQKYANKLKE